MGYKNSSQIFAQFIQHVALPELKGYLNIYVDDLLITGTKDSITQITKDVITHFGQYSIRFSDTKMQYKQTEIEHLR